MVVWRLPVVVVDLRLWGPQCVCSCRCGVVEVTCGSLRVTCSCCRLEAVEVTHGRLLVTCGSCSLGAVDVTCLWAVEAKNGVSQEHIGP